jgi:outer membrane lipoprotein-sorting protein
MFSLCFVFPLLVFAAGKSNSLLNETSLKYRRAGLIEMKFEKNLKTLTGGDRKYSGKIFLASGLVKIENLEPEKSTMIFDGISLWNVQPASEDFPGPPQVSRSKVEKTNKAQLFFVNLLSKDPLDKSFKTLSENKADGFVTFELEPFDKSLNIKKVKLKIQAKKKEIVELTYEDDIENSTQMNFSGISLKKNKSKKTFQYTPPKNVQVIEL